MNKNFLTLLLILYSIVTYAQDPNYYTIGEKDFANTSVYTLLYDDSSDLLYAGTNKGIFVYKNNQFSKLKNTENLDGNSFFDLKRSNSGYIYCKNFRGQIFKLTENAYSLFYEAEKTSGSFDYLLKKNNDIIISTTTNIFLINEEGKFIKSLLNEKIIYKGEPIEITKIHSSSKVKAYFLFNVSTKDNKTLILEYKNDKIQIVSELPYLRSGLKGNHSFNSLIHFENKLFSMQQNGEIFSVSEQKFVPIENKEKERTIHINNDLTIGMSSTNGLRYFYLSNGILKASRTHLENTFISAICLTKKNTTIIGTFNEGVIVIPNREIEKINIQSLLLDIEVSNNNNVAVSTRSGEIFTYNNKHLLLADKHNSNIDNIFYYEGETKFKSKIKNIYSNNTNSIFEGAKDVKFINDNTFLMASNMGVHLYQFSSKNEHLPTSRESAYSKNSYNNIDYYQTIFKDSRTSAVEWNKNDSLIYYANTNGVYSKDLSNSKTEILLLENNSFLANDLLFFDNTLICATSKNGLLFYENNKLVNHITEKDGLKDNYTNQIEKKDSWLYILSEKGLQIYDLKKKIFLYLGKSNGIDCAQVNKFALSKDKIWILENHSFYSLDISEIEENKTISTLNELSVTVKGKNIDITKEHNFKDNQNPYIFEFDYNNIDTKREAKIHYKLDGLEKEWTRIKTTKNFVKYDYLPKGNYTFNIKATFRGQSTKTIKYSFEVLPPYWQQWWFYLLIVGIVSVIISTIAYYKIKLIRIENTFKLKQKSIEHEVVDAKIQSIKAQMNPHFIYNTINSIQELILQKDTLNAYDYLSKFAVLVRNIIEGSDKEFILLDKEIDFIKIYLDFEKLRFNKNFNFKINSEIETKIEIPSSIIQPFLENAIKYRLLHKTGGKEISLNIEIENKLIKCTITDNGIGLTKEKEFKQKKQKDYQSFSAVAIDKRLQILEELHSIKIDYSINDIQQNGEISGTEVVILIPQKIVQHQE